MARVEEPETSVVKMGIERVLGALGRFAGPGQAGGRSAGATAGPWRLHLRLRRRQGNIRIHARVSSFQDHD
jgi:uncharacterized RDD family membrane protein YckC